MECIAISEKSFIKSPLYLFFFFVIFKITQALRMVVFIFAALWLNKITGFPNMLLPCMDLSELYEESLTLQKHVIHFTKLWMFFETTPNQEQQSQKSAALWTLMPLIKVSYFLVLTHWPVWHYMSLLPNLHLLTTYTWVI